MPLVRVEVCASRRKVPESDAWSVRLSVLTCLMVSMDVKQY